VSHSVRKRADIENPVVSSHSAAAATNGSRRPPAEPDALVTPVTELRPGRQRILDVARGLFSSGGYERTPLRAISDALGVTKAALYYHFPAKEHLLVAIVGPMLDRIDELLDSLGPVLQSAGQRREFLSRYVEELSSHADIAALLLRDPAVGGHPLGQRFAVQHTRMRALLGAQDDLATGIRAVTALRALELAVVEFDDADPVVRETALNIALAVLDDEPQPRTTGADDR
jgi:AcrR family transcriptional regulator